MFQKVELERVRLDSTEQSINPFFRLGAVLSSTMKFSTVMRRVTLDFVIKKRECLRLEVCWYVRSKMFTLLWSKILNP